MNFEQEIFKRTHVYFKKLEHYGFHKVNHVYYYSKVFMDDFRADLTVNKDGIVTGKVFDLNTEEEYINFRIEHQTGEFVGHVREKYIELLQDICSSCFEKNYFITGQANRITKKIFELYRDKPEFAWKTSPGFGIFRNPDTDKWYGLIINIDQSKLNKNRSGEIEAINLKLDAHKILHLLTREGFYPAYHMNKKYWITIALDDTLSDQEILECIKESHRFTENLKEWIIPANTKYYDVLQHFEHHQTITWKQTSNMKIGDIIYLYLGSPYSAILYKCEVIEGNIPCSDCDEPLSPTGYIMKLKLLKTYERDEYTLTKLKEYGVRAIRGPRHIPASLSKKMNQLH